MKRGNCSISESKQEHQENIRIFAMTIHKDAMVVLIL